MAFYEFHHSTGSFFVLVAPLLKNQAFNRNESNLYISKQQQPTKQWYSIFELLLPWYLLSKLSDLKSLYSFASLLVHLWIVSS